MPERSLLGVILEGLLGRGSPGRRRAAQASCDLADDLERLGFASGSRLSRLLGDKLGSGGSPKGTLARLYLELCTQIHLPPPRLNSSQQAPPALLIVAHEPTFAQAIAREASIQGLQTTIVRDAGQARSAFLRLHPVALVMDTPSESDWELASELAAARQNLPLVMLGDSWTGRDDWKARRLRTRPLRKPLSPSRVVSEALMQIDRSRSSPVRLLLAPRQPAVGQELARILGAWEFRVLVATPADFWKRLEESDPDLILLWSDRQGLAACSALRRSSRFGTQPVLVVTDSEQTSRMAYEAGADDCIEQPFLAGELVVRVTSQLKLARDRATASALDALTGFLHFPDWAVATSRLLRLAGRQGDGASLAIVRLDASRTTSTTGTTAFSRNPLLGRLADSLHSAFRMEDAIGRSGDSFLLGLYGMTRSDGFRRLAEVLERLMALEHGLRISAGLANFPEDGRDVQSLYKAAEDALAEAGRAGGGRVVDAGWTARLDVIDVPCQGDAKESSGAFTGGSRNQRLSQELGVAREGREQAEAENVHLRATAQRFSNELEVARTIQEALLPPDYPEVDGWTIRFGVVPARLVGGDLVKFFRRDKFLGVAVADVMGKGIPAAMLVGSLHQILCKAESMPLAEAVREINDTLFRLTPPEVCIALILCLVDTESGAIEFYNAGAPCPLVYRAERRAVEQLCTENLPLGWFSEMEAISTQKIQLQHGDCFALHTDGLTDAFFEGTRVRVGDERVRRLLAARGGLELEDLLERLLHLAVSPVQPDDVALVMIRRVQRNGQ